MASERAWLRCYQTAAKIPGLQDAMLRRARAMIRSGQAAARQYDRIHWGRRPDRAVRGDVAEVAPGDIVTEIGVLEEVCYAAAKGDEPAALWVHPFSSPKPWLCVAADGKLVIVGGGYSVSARGIVG